MAHVVRNAKKSPSPLVTDIKNGVDLFVGQDIIYEWEGTLYWGICQGWHTADGIAVVKVDQIAANGSNTVPTEKVWRIWDVRDAQIEELERMVYECVSLSSVMRNGLSEETYNRITAKFEKE